MMGNSGIWDARYVLFGTRRLNVPAFRSHCPSTDVNPVASASNSIVSFTQLLSCESQVRRNAYSKFRCQPPVISTYNACELKQYRENVHSMHICQKRRINCNSNINGEIQTNNTNEKSTNFSDSFTFKMFNLKWSTVVRLYHL